MPSLALILYLLHKAKSLKEWGISAPNKKDIIPFLLSFPVLVLIGLTISNVSSYIKLFPAGPKFLPPQTVISWLVLVVSCVSSAYLEESYFRFYLLSKREEMGLSPAGAVLVSTLLFSLCHVYAGPWGFLNGVFAGIFLAYIFLCFRSLHGIAIAHSLYNIMVYFMNTEVISAG
jgi:membrane protease YdiL (CAAX protease family)